MDMVQAAVLGVIQGLTEFLPISSSGHLVIVPALFGWEVQRINFDVAVHMGTLIAIVIFFRRRLFTLAKNVFVSGNEGRMSRLFVVTIFISIIPAVVVGAVAGDLIEQKLRTPLIAIVNLIGWGIVLWLADWYTVRRAKRGPLMLDSQKIAPHKGFLIGCAQALALMPGVSRSGITISAGLFGGLSRTAAVEFSFIMSIPVIAAAAAAKAAPLVSSAFLREGAAAFATGMVAAFVSGLFALWILTRVAARYRLWPFALYRIVAGVVFLWIIV